MFENDGYVYGENTQTALKIIKVQPLKDKKMIVEFSTGEKRMFDASILSGPVFEPLNETAVFEDVKIEYGVVTWKDGTIDCAPEYMYDHSFEYGNVS